MTAAPQDLTEIQRMIRDTVREFAQNELSKRARHADETGKFPIENFRRMAELNLTGIPVPEELGGAGADTLSFVLAIEEIAKVCGSTALTLAAHTTLATMPIVRFGTEAQKRKYVPPLARGDYAGAFCSTEANIGSDVAGAQTAAVRAQGGYILNGQKMFVTNASFAGTLLVSAVTDKLAEKHKRLSAFIVEKNSPGVSVVKEEDKLGMRGSATCVVNFDNVWVPEENRLGQEGDGFRIYMDTLNNGRIGIAGLALGLAEAAMEKALQYSKTRVAFGRPIASQQAIQFMIADMATEIEAARLLMIQAARLKDEGRPYAKEAAMAKLFSSEMAMRVTRNAIQILGGYGYMTEYEVERYYRDAKLCEIGEGTSEIQRIIIARQVMGKL